MGRFGLGLASVLIGVGLARAAEPPPQPVPALQPLAPPAVAPAPVAETLALTDDAAARMTIAVMVDGQGPFPFIIDTGADRTVISRELAAALNLPLGPHVTMHDSAGVDDVQTARITRLTVGKRVVEGIDAPMLAAADLGAAGLLGIDSLHDQHVVLDFKSRRLSSLPSRSEIYEPGTIVVRGKSRFGQLVLVDAVVRGVPVYVILDSGAQNTVGNLALRRLLTRGSSHAYPPTEVISVTGRATPAEFADVADMRLGEMTIRNMPLAFASLHTFDRFGLTDKPAMLLGMDVLGLCQKVTVDFKRREATFVLN